MGIIQSKIRSIGLAVGALLEQICLSLDLLYHKAVIDEVIARLEQPPGLPLPNPTTSFWLVPESDLLSHIQSPELPKDADIVIIGSGISATAVLRELYRLSPDLKVVVLEARGVATGATGRNGGHIKEGPFEEYHKLKKKLGNDAAARIVRFRLRHLEELKEVAKEEGEECVRFSEIREVLGTDVVFDEASMQSELEWLKEWKTDFPQMSREWTVMDAQAAKENLHIPNAVGAICGPAGALWPYRLCTSILERLVQQHDCLKIETFTPVEHISFDASSSIYTLTTPRGKITTSTVIHTTNGWASQLLPGMRTKIFPFQGQMSAQAPPEGLPPMGDKYSWSFIHKEGFDYLTQRPTVYKQNTDGTASLTGGEMMFGGGWAMTGNSGMDVIGIADDTKLNYLAAGYLSGLLPFVFGTGTDDGKKRAWGGVDVKDMWSGVIGFSSDMLPFVGKVPTSITTRGQPKAETGKHNVKTGEWISAGFSGEGMVNCWGCGTALARMVLGESVVKNVEGKERRVRSWKGEEEVKTWRETELAEWFPAEFIITKPRVAKATPIGVLAWLNGD